MIPYTRDHFVAIAYANLLARIYAPWYNKQLHLDLAHSYMDLAHKRAL